MMKMKMMMRTAEGEGDNDNVNGEKTEDSNAADGEADELSMSLAAMEDSVRDGVLAQIDSVAATFKELSQLRDRRLSTIKRGSTPSARRKKVQRITHQDDRADGWHPAQHKSY